MEINMNNAKIVIGIICSCARVEAPDSEEFINANLDRTIDSFDLDSLDRIELLMDIEDEFAIDIKDCVAERWVTVRDIVTTVNSLVV